MTEEIGNIKGTPQRASTDENGFYTLDNVPVGDRTYAAFVDRLKGFVTKGW